MRDNLLLPIKKISFPASFDSFIYSYNKIYGFYIRLPRKTEIICYFQLRKCHLQSLIIALFARIPNIFGLYILLFKMRKIMLLPFIEVTAGV